MLRYFEERELQRGDFLFRVT